MARGIKGLVVEIGGDTSGLQKSLQQAQKSSTSLITELNKINKSLKLDTKNPELLAQKQEVLNDAIKNTEKYLNDLKKYQKDILDSGIELTGKNAEKYRELQREIAEVQNKLNKLKFDNSTFIKLGQALDNAGTKIKNLGNNISNLGQKLSTISVPTIAALTGVAKSAIDFETAFAGVEKTVDGTTEQMANLKQGIKDMAKEVPSTTTEIAGVAEAAGQLGIATDDVLSFTKTMIDLGNSTNLSATEAASALAKFANITGTSSKDFNKLGSVIVDLGNNFATTEADIVSMATGLASTGELAGLTEPQIFALATAMSSVGIEAQAGSTAMSKLLKKIQVSVETGSKDLKQFAKVAGVSASDFKKAYEEDAVKALSMFISGLQDTERNGKSAIAILDDMGIKEVRLSNTILSLSNSSEMMTKAIDTANKAWKEDTALVNEANKRYATTESKLKITWNQIKNVAINIGNKLLPIIQKVLEKISGWLSKLEGLNDEQMDTIVKIGMIVAAAGPLLKILGSVTSTIGSVVKGFGTFTTAVGVLKTGVESSNKAANALAGGIKALASPVGLATTAIAGLATIIATVLISQIQKTKEEWNKTMETIFSGIGQWDKAVQDAKGSLEGFNSTLFATSEEQTKLSNNMQTIQDKITQICRNATAQRRGLTDKEIKKLKEYFKELELLAQKELEIQQSIGAAVEQQAQLAAQSFEGTAEEYRLLGAKWIATAEEQKDQIIKTAEEQCTTQIALLNQMYGDKATLDNEEYAKEYNRIQEQKDKVIKAEQDRVGRIYDTYSKGYETRITESNTFAEKYKKYLKDVENAEQDYNNANKFLFEANLNELGKYGSTVKKSWDETVGAMTQAEKDQMSNWIEMLANTELYGGEITDEDKEIVDTIIKTYDKLPEESKKSMNDAMQGMLKGIKDREPSLFEKANSLANGIISRLNKAFEIKSPSRVMRRMFNYVVEGAELGMKDEEQNLFREADKIAQTTIDAFETPQLAQGKLSSAAQPNYNNITLNFNPQSMTEAELDRAFNYVNRRLGTAY